jgi:AAA+ ATPase superfamily predicted ATPase
MLLKEDIEILKEDGQHFALSEKIVNSDRFEGAIIYGVQRIGKSSYALQVAFDVYKDWRDVFNNLFFKLDDLIEYLQFITHQHDFVDCIIMDDAGVHLSKFNYFSNRSNVKFLSQLFDVIGIAVKSVLFTTPSPENLLKFLRRYEFSRVKIIKQTDYRRIAKGYRNTMLPSGSTRVKTEFVDHYKVKLPNDIFEKYNKIRWTYLDQVLQDFLKNPHTDNHDNDTYMPPYYHEFNDSEMMK